MITYNDNVNGLIIVMLIVLPGNSDDHVNGMIIILIIIFWESLFGNNNNKCRFQ